jgi:hypothetical protein
MNPDIIENIRQNLLNWPEMPLPHRFTKDEINDRSAFINAFQETFKTPQEQKQFKAMVDSFMASPAHVQQGLTTLSSPSPPEIATADDVASYFDNPGGSKRRTTRRRRRRRQKGKSKCYSKSKVLTKKKRKVY